MFVFGMTVRPSLYGVGFAAGTSIGDADAHMDIAARDAAAMQEPEKAVVREEREHYLKRYREKKRRRSKANPVRYHKRKLYADSR